MSGYNVSQGSPEAIAMSQSMEGITDITEILANTILGFTVPFMILTMIMAVMIGMLRTFRMMADEDSDTSNGSCVKDYDDEIDYDDTGKSAHIYNGVGYGYGDSEFGIQSEQKVSIMSNGDDDDDDDDDGEWN